MKWISTEEEDIVSFLLELDNKDKMDFRQVVNTGFLSKNRNKAHDRLSTLIRKGLVREENRASWKPSQTLWYVITPKGMRWLIKKTTLNLKEGIKNAQGLIKEMLTPLNVYRFRNEATPPLPKRFSTDTDPGSPASIGFRTEEESREISEHKEKVLGALRTCLYDLTRLVVKVDFGSIYAEEDPGDDLSNIKMGFKNKQPYFIVDPGTPSGERALTRKEWAARIQKMKKGLDLGFSDTEGKHITT